MYRISAYWEWWKMWSQYLTTADLVMPDGLVGVSQKCAILTQAFPLSGAKKSSVNYLWVKTPRWWEMLLLWESSEEIDSIWQKSTLTEITTLCNQSKPKVISNAAFVDDLWQQNTTMSQLRIRAIFINKFLHKEAYIAIVLSKTKAAIQESCRSDSAGGEEGMRKCLWNIKYCLHAPYQTTQRA